MKMRMDEADEWIMECNEAKKKEIIVMNLDLTQQLLKS